ncbi:MAG TPA: shikimate kinase [bacterium]|nr:shikimate kinase [bacterium]
MFNKFGGNIYLIGFMASGKSTIGPLLAKKMKRPFLDTDEWIEVETGLSIAEFFQKYGEAEFRRKENNCIRKIAEINAMVIAVGGGAVINPANWLRLKQSGITIYLKCPVQEIIKRVNKDSSRPLLTGDESQKADRIRNLFLEREPFYEMADITIECQPNDIPETTVKRIIEKLEVTL